MGEELGTVFHKLKNEIVFLHQQWNTYTDLYGTEDSRIDILNRGASSFFFIVQKGLFENIIMSLARLTDPPTIGKFKNFTLRALPYLIRDESLKKEIELGLEMIVHKAVEFAREWRSKVYAHRDYEIKLGRVTLEENASKQNIEFALKAIRDLMDKVTLHYENSRTVYQGDAYSGGSNALLFVIQDGLNCREYMRKKEYAGEEIDNLLKTNHITHVRRELDL
ncbi:MAG: hypothetical protein IPL46_11950 [Saprospiraceae bacterium]|nr:hypothetical protein [Saprospiraceae bacterium]